MTYFEGFVVAVPEANKEVYRKHAADAAPIFKEFGVRRHFEAWDSDVPEGKVLRVPGIEDVSIPVEPTLIIELLSK